MKSEAVGRAETEAEFAGGWDFEEDGKWWMRIGEPLLTVVKCGMDRTGAGSGPGAVDHPYRVNRDGGATHASRMHA